MSSDFEKFIRKNRGDFDDESPSGDVWKKIEKTIRVKKDPKRFTIRDIYKWSAAAAIFFIALTSVYFLVIKEYSHETQSVKTNDKQSLSLPENFNGIDAQYAVEMKEASLQIEQRQQELKAAVANDPALYKKFQEDLNTLDSSYRMLRDKADQSINRDVIIKAMIQNLQLQSELLGRQLMIIHEFKTTKTSKNEKDL
jgi:hypothetical protein